YFNISSTISNTGVEEVKSEFRRSLLLPTLFFLIMVIGVLNFLATAATVSEFFGSLKTVGIIIGSVFLFLGYQVLILRNLNKKLKLQQNTSTAFKTFNSIIEITFMSLTTFCLVT